MLLLCFQRVCGSKSRSADAACINQQDISASLVLLPIFLHGCKMLLILPGQTYPTRLWCLIELFTFVKMGGTRERVCIRPLLAASDDQKQLGEALLRVDAKVAGCYLLKDRDRLLGIIEASFGDCRAFNGCLHAFFEEHSGFNSSGRSPRITR